MKKFLLQADYDFGWDGFMQDPGPDPAKRLEDCYFYHIDRGEARVDAILWDNPPYLEQEVPDNDLPVRAFCRERGIDLMGALIAACHRRGIRAILHHRVSEVDRALIERRPGKEGWNPVKLAHPDWIIKTWYSQGLWNMDVPALRAYKLEYLGRVMEKYDFDGVCVDFLRHTPVLPVGRQWECRGSLTAFLCDLRALLDGIRPGLLLGAKTGENAHACRADGFDVAEWVKRGAVDFFEVGSRTMDVELDWYRAITAGTAVELYPCWDVWHSSEAMHLLQGDAYRALLANWIGQGADGVVGFNFSPAPLCEVQKLGQETVLGCDTEQLNPDYLSFYRSFLERDDPTLPQTYMAERRGGYPYGTGSSSTNELAPLPMVLPNDGTPAEVPLTVLAAPAGRSVTVRFLVTGAREGIDRFEAYLNGERLEGLRLDFAFVDPQIFYPKPQNPSGRRYCTRNHPEPLLEITAQVDPRLLTAHNRLGLAVIDRTDYCTSAMDISIARAEIRLQ